MNIEQLNVNTVKLREALLPLVNKFDEELTKVLAEFGYLD